MRCRFVDGPYPGCSAVVARTSTPPPRLEELAIASAQYVRATLLAPAFTHHAPGGIMGIVPSPGASHFHEALFVQCMPAIQRVRLRATNLEFVSNRLDVKKIMALARPSRCPSVVVPSSPKTAGLMQYGAVCSAASAKGALLPAASAQRRSSSSRQLPNF